MITLKNLSKTFQQKNQPFKALDDINLDVEEADIVGIIGSSGAGKSTLIRCVNLLERPDHGQILIKGKDLTGMSNRALAQERRKIGMIFQHFNLLASRTVYDNVAFPLELEKQSASEIDKKVTQLLEIVGLSDKAREYPKSLSGGQKQRVAIARALANDPYLLLCDEATSALDPATTESILQLLRSINQKLKITILLITHEMHVVKSICNHIAVIDHGKLVAKGTLAELLSGEEHPIIKQFINRNSMTIPQAIFNNLKTDQAPGLFPVIEIELKGTVSFETLIDSIYNRLKVPYKIIKADIENIGKSSFGRLLLHLQGTPAEIETAIGYFNTNKIYNSIRGYV